MKKFRIPFDQVNWITSSFLIGTLFLSLTAVPLYLWHYGLNWFQGILFFVMFCFCGFSITLGYHRHFSHLAFKAHWLVRLFTLTFGAGAFENSALMWSSEHRRHHKFVDHDDDPYDISKGFFYAHAGWLMFKLAPQPPFDNVQDLDKDPMVRFQHRYIHLLAVLVGFGFPALVGYLYQGGVGALGGFLLGGVLRTVALQHCTFFINSACHTIGSRPYSSRCSARDSWIMALFTFGEGYHNYHHEFQHDYRNGVKPWQFDPTKWIIWTLNKLGLARNLRQVSAQAIFLAELRETQRTFDVKVSNATASMEDHSILLAINTRLAALSEAWDHYQSKQIEVSRETLSHLREELRSLISQIRSLDLSSAAAA
jgi:stearoyl-CoA desaturase (delta-9 desaturase)